MEISTKVKKSALKLIKILLNSKIQAHISLDKCIQLGFVVLDKNNKIVTNFSNDNFNLLYAKYEGNVKLFNETFHKNFDETKKMSDAKYYSEQILHYFSTYGLESIGKEAIPYIPCEILDIPKEFNRGRIEVIKILDESDFTKRIDNYLKNIKAPHFSTIEDIKILLKECNLQLEDLKSIELQTMMCEMKHIIPENPILFLKLVVYKLTNETMLIKNEELINKTKNVAKADPYNTELLTMFQFANQNNLASIFYRYKPIFLALRRFYGMKKIINKIRRLAPKFHKPLSDVCVQNVIRIGRNENRKEDFNKILQKMSNCDLVKCINNINNNNSTKAYTIRNNKTFVKNNSNLNNDTYMQHIFMEELKNRISNKFNGKTFILPSYLEYAVPVSEKQMIYNIPYGSYAKLGNDCMTVGIAWNNFKKEKDGFNSRVDIDLHLMSTKGHYGWNSRRQNEDVIYTGDMTDATNGAAEAFWINNTKNDYIAVCNQYSDNEANAKFKFFATKTKPENFDRNYTYNPEQDIFSAIDLQFNNDASLTLGLYTNTKFFFYGNTISSGCVPQEHYEEFIEALKYKLSSQLNFSTLIKIMGGNVVYDENKKFDGAINLLPENLQIDTLMNLINEN